MLQNCTAPSRTRHRMLPCQRKDQAKDAKAQPRPALRPSDRQTCHSGLPRHMDLDLDLRSLLHPVQSTLHALRQRIPVRQISKHALLTCLAVLPPPHRCSCPIIGRTPRLGLRNDSLLPVSPSRTVFDYSSCHTVILPPDLLFYLLQPASLSPSSTTLA